MDHQDSNLFDNLEKNHSIDSTDFYFAAGVE